MEEGAGGGGSGGGRVGSAAGGGAVCRRCVGVDREEVECAGSVEVRMAALLLLLQVAVADG